MNLTVWTIKSFKQKEVLSAIRRESGFLLAAAANGEGWSARDWWGGGPVALAIADAGCCTLIIKKVDYGVENPYAGFKRKNKAGSQFTVANSLTGNCEEVKRSCRSDTLWACLMSGRSSGRTTVRSLAGFTGSTLLPAPSTPRCQQRQPACRTPAELRSNFRFTEKDSPLFCFSRCWSRAD